MNTRNYKLGQMELALVAIRQKVVRPQDSSPLYLTGMQAVMILECARLGAAEMYKNSSLTDFYYPIP